ncbi:MAG: hypothetical protein N3D71_11430, partial [Burkholderiaceae bacterium]|nr:hypothetical protein [Burkholderiaceae bacterium]
APPRDEGKPGWHLHSSALSGGCDRANRGYRYARLPRPALDRAALLPTIADVMNRRECSDARYAATERARLRSARLAPKDARRRNAFHSHDNRH